MPYLLRLSFSSISNKFPSRSSLQTLIISSMAGSGEDLSSFSNITDSITIIDSSTNSQINESSSIVDSSNDQDLKFGFKRPEMYKEKFPLTVDPYDRHVFLCYKNAESWPARVEDVNYDPLPGNFAVALKSRKDDIQRKTRFTVIEGGDRAEFSDGDVLIFPEMIKYKSLTHVDVDNFVEDVLVKGTTWARGTPEVLNGFHVFVCTHTSRDKRCGVCGPVLVDKLKQEIELRGLKDQILVSPCSHVGGHKYAGNVIIFGPNSEGKVMGHWYGYVTPDDIPLLLDQHIGKGVVVEHLWRGEMCNSYEVKEQEAEQKPQESNGVAYPNGTDLQKNEEEPLGSSTKGNVQNGVSCCQGANGFSCCRDDTAEVDGRVADKKPREGKNVCARGLDRVSTLMGKWEQTDVLAATAVIGAVASVAVAYSIYRRSG